MNMLIVLLSFLLGCLAALVFYIYSFGKSALSETEKAAVISRDEIIHWQRLMVEFVEEMENLYKDIEKKLEEKLKRVDEKIGLMDHKIKEAENISERPNIQSFPALPAESQTFQEPFPSFASEFKPKTETRVELSPVHSKIYELADLGKDIVDIAREAQLGKGEVKLILELRRSSSM